ncbi:glycoside hydrolase family 3 C-terminal domain-containing protein, partial [bacterium]|nr:glycoside hydrolase family 3 C-terminal domain-containing protein [bacterium]
YVNGKPIAEPWIAENINSVIEAWEPGSFGGQAVGEIIFGEVNPSGKLPLTFPRSVGQLQMVYNHKPSQYFHKYAVEKITPLYPFGHGLSYSEFKYSDLEVNKLKSENSLINVSFIISNNSDSFGEEIVQIYFRDSYSSVTRPVKELLKYKRVSLKPRESKNKVHAYACPYQHQQIETKHLLGFQQFYEGYEFVQYPSNH